MDASSPAAFVNGDLLRTYLGRRIRTVLQVLQTDVGSMTGLTADGHQLSVMGAPALTKSHFVEVIGIAEGGQSIRAEICTDFGAKFDTVAYNRLCQLANGEYKNLFL